MVHELPAARISPGARLDPASILRALLFAIAFGVVA